MQKQIKDRFKFYQRVNVLVNIPHAIHPHQILQFLPSIPTPTGDQLGTKSTYKEKKKLEYYIFLACQIHSLIRILFVALFEDL